MAVGESIGLILLVCGAVVYLLNRVLTAREANRPRGSVEEARPEVLAVAAGGSDGEFIRAVKVLRERTGLGLLEAKDTVTH